MSSKSTRQNEYSEFLPAALEILETPPAPASRYLIFTIVAFFAFAIGWSIWGQIDVIVTGQGRIIPTGNVKTVQAFETGIVTDILVSEGDYVRQGETLISLDPTDTDASVGILGLQLAEAKLDFAAAQALLTDQDWDTLVADIDVSDLQKAETQNQVVAARLSLAATQNELLSEKQQLEAQIVSIGIEKEKLESVIPVMRERLNASGTLLRRDAMRDDDRLVLEQTLIETRSARRALDQTLAQSQARLLGIEAQQSQVMARFQTDQLALRRTALATISDLEQQTLAEQRRQRLRSLTAPVSGYVDKLVAHTVGGVVGAGDVLMNIVPEGSSIEIEAMVQNKDVGFIRAGFPAEIKLEAFPFTRYGVLEGEVTNISNDAINHDTFGLVYKVSARITTDPQAIADAGIAISPGMTTTLEIQTDKRRVIDYFISPVLRYKDEAIRER